MSLEDDLAALHRRTSDPAHRGACPAAGELFSLLDGAATPAERERLVDHLAGCTACAEEVRLMRSLRPWAEEVAGRLAAPHPLAPSPIPSPLPGEGEKRDWAGRGRPSPGRREGMGEGTGVRGRRSPLPLAAALVAAVIGAGILLQRDVIAPPDAAVLRGARFERVSPAADAVLQQPPAELAWPPQPGATGYRLRLFDEAANLLWESPPLREPKEALPPGVRSRLRPGASYFWTVEVEGPARHSQLGPYWFRLD